MRLSFLAFSAWRRSTSQTARKSPWCEAPWASPEPWPPAPIRPSRGRSFLARVSSARVRPKGEKKGSERGARRRDAEEIPAVLRADGHRGGPSRQDATRPGSPDRRPPGPRPRRYKSTIPPARVMEKGYPPCPPRGGRGSGDDRSTRQIKIKIKIRTRKRMRSKRFSSRSSRVRNWARSRFSPPRRW